MTNQRDFSTTENFGLLQSEVEIDTIIKRNLYYA